MGPRTEAHRVVRSRLVAIGVAVGLALALAAASPVTTAQPTPSTGFSVDDHVVTFYTYRGGARAFGAPISRTFELLGQHVQLFQNAALIWDLQTSVAELPGSSWLPITAADGLIFPGPDADLLAALPDPADPNYRQLAQAFFTQHVPDVWNGVPVNFRSTVAGTVSCDVAFPIGDCALDRLAEIGVDVWGLPTSDPAADPNESGIVYQRFQRGVLRYSSATGQTTWLPLGEWFKDVLLGTNLSPDLAAQVQDSRYLGQYQPDQPDHVARPLDLPASLLGLAFTPEFDPVLGPPRLTQTAVAATEQIGGTQASLAATAAVAGQAYGAEMATAYARAVPFGSTHIGQHVDPGSSSVALRGSRIIFRPERHGNVGMVSISFYVGAVEAAPDDYYVVTLYSDINGHPGILGDRQYARRLMPYSWNTVPLNAYYAIAADRALWLLVETGPSASGRNELMYDDEPDAGFTSFPIAFDTEPSMLGGPLTARRYSMYLGVGFGL